VGQHCAVPGCSPIWVRGLSYCASGALACSHSLRFFDLPAKVEFCPAHDSVPVLPCVESGRESRFFAVTNSREIGSLGRCRFGQDGLAVEKQGVEKGAFARFHLPDDADGQQERFLAQPFARSAASRCHSSSWASVSGKSFRQGERESSENPSIRAFLFMIFFSTQNSPANQIKFFSFTRMAVRDSLRRTVWLVKSGTIPW